MCDFVRSLDIAAKLMRQYWVQVNTSKFNQNEFRLSETLIWASMYIRHTKGWTDRQTLTYLLITPWKRVLLEKVTGSQLVKKFPAFYGSRRFITAFTSVRHLSLSWATSIQSMPSHPTFWRSILILSSHLRLGVPSGLIPSGFPTTILYTPLLSPVRSTCPVYLISIISPEQYWLSSIEY